MSAAPWTATDQGHHAGKKRDPKIVKRNNAAYEAIDRAMNDSDPDRRLPEHLGTTLKWLIWTCDAELFTTIKYTKLARLRGVNERAIEMQMQALRERNLIRVERAGRVWRKFIVMFEADGADERAPDPEIVALNDANALIAAAQAALAAGEHDRARALKEQAALRLLHDAHTDECKKISERIPDPDCDPYPIQTAGMDDAPPINQLNPDLNQQAVACNGDGGVTFTASAETEQNKAATQPEPEVVQRLRAFGLGHRPTLQECSAAPLKAREVLDACLAKGGAPGLFYVMWREGVWKRGGQRGKAAPDLPLPDDDDAWRDKYTGGPLGPYIRTGLDDPPDDDTGPPGNEPDPELDKYRRIGIGVPKWLDGGAA